MMAGMPSMNLMCFVLWRMSIIAVSMATEPPAADTISNVRSLMRCAPLRAASLSYKVKIAANKLTMTNYMASALDKNSAMNPPP